MKNLLILLLGCLVVSCSSAHFDQESNATLKPKNIILLIGDGTGLSQVSSALYFKDGPSNFERFPVVGLIKTSSSSDLITDSAAGATAFANGVKTYNGAIGVNSDTIPVPNLLDIADQFGIRSGIISTSSITHATPASFYAHVESRKLEEDIAAYLTNAPIDFIAGAGYTFFVNRKDGKNIFAEMSRKGFAVDTTSLSNNLGSEKWAYILAPTSMPKMIEGRGDFLQQASSKAIAKLEKNKKGFFLMVEGSQIDWGGHDNDATYLITELVDFDNTIGDILDYAKKNGETLVIVTADHETGGFTLGANNGNYNEIAPSFSTGGHSGTMIPVFAYGPGSENFGGIYENNEIFYKIKTLMKEHDSEVNKSLILLP